MTRQEFFVPSVFSNIVSTLAVEFYKVRDPIKYYAKS